MIDNGRSLITTGNVVIDNGKSLITTGNVLIENDSRCSPLGTLC